MLTLYPDIKPYIRHTLAVDSIHQLYIEECGNPEGLPVLFLHGGPGAGCRPHHRCFFDPDIYRIILFDQRGCGRSTPRSELQENTTPALLADIAQIRDHLGIKRWLIFGTSWGSALALLYAETYPDQILGLILHGIFLARAQDTRWFLQEGAPQVFPDAWACLVKNIPPEKQNDLLTAFADLLSGTDELAQMAAAKALGTWKSSCAGFTQSVAPYDNQTAILAQAHIQTHYAKHHYFIAPNQILANAHQLATIPGVITHGRYDMICPLRNAWELYQAWPVAQLHIVPAAGHRSSDLANADALVHATQIMARELQ